eukprot:12512055-Alexandrium_andersonii.AAC.1
MPSIMEGSMPICTIMQGSIVPPIMPAKVEEFMPMSMPDCFSMFGSTPICINMQGCIMLPVMPSIM